MNMFKSKSASTAGGATPAGETPGADTAGKDTATDGADGGGKGGDGKAPEVGQMKPGDYMIHVGTPSLSHDDVGLCREGKAAQGPRGQHCGPAHRGHCLGREEVHDGQRRHQWNRPLFLERAPLLRTPRRGKIITIHLALHRP